MSERVWLYVGGGDTLPGVPRRSLTAEEYAQHQERIEANRQATGRRMWVPLMEMDEATARLSALIDSLGAERRLTWDGAPLGAPLREAEVIAGQEDEDGLPEFGFKGDEGAAISSLPRSDDDRTDTA